MVLFYTPQPIVDFMVNSVEISPENRVQPVAVGYRRAYYRPILSAPGNFIVRLMQDIQKNTIRGKINTGHELHLQRGFVTPLTTLPNLNIEQEFLHHTKKYLPFEGIVFADTFELF